MSKTAKCAVDLAEPAAADGCPRQAERKALAAMPDSQVDHSYIPPLSSH